MPALDFPWVLLGKDTQRIPITASASQQDSPKARLRDALNCSPEDEFIESARKRLLAVLKEARPSSSTDATPATSEVALEEPVYHLLTAMRKVAIHEDGILLLDRSKLSPAFCLVNVACVSGETTLIQQALPRQAYSPSFDPAQYIGEVQYDADAVFDSSDLDEPLTIQGSIVPLAPVFRPEPTEDSAVEVQVDRRLSDSTVPFSSSIEQNFGSDSAISRRTSKTSCCSSQCDSTASFVMNNFGPSRLLMRERSLSLSKKKAIAPAIAPRVAFFDGHSVTLDASSTTDGA